MTIKTVTFMSRADTKRKLAAKDFPPNSVAIGICDTEDELLELHDLMWNCWELDDFAVVCLKDDNSDQERKLVQLLFDIDQMVIWTKPEHVFINCFMGISRSAAVAKYINDKYGLNDKRLQNYTQYNIDIYEQLCKIGGVQTMKQYYEGMK